MNSVSKSFKAQPTPLVSLFIVVTTILSAIFLPLTFLTGFFGQNFDHLPFHSVAFMWAAFGCCIIVPPSMLFWFWRRGWL